MNYLIYPCKYMNITQSYLGSYSHNNNYNGYPKDYPIDEACQDEKRSYILILLQLIQFLFLLFSQKNTLFL